MSIAQELYDELYAFKVGLQLGEGLRLRLDESNSSKLVIVARFNGFDSDYSMKVYDIAAVKLERTSLRENMSDACRVVIYDGFLRKRQLISTPEELREYLLTNRS